MRGSIVNGVQLTPRETEVYNALTNEPDWPGVIANRAGIRTISRSETAAKFCIALVRKGLAKKHGTAMFPKWSKA
jgi:hypothetical protein